jgi:hypothetical protein
MATALRPLGIGEMIDAAVKIYRDRWRPMLTAVVVVTAPVVVLTALVQLSAGTGEPDAFLRTDPDTGLAELDGRRFALFTAGALVNVVLSVISTAVATAAVFRMVSGVYLGDEIGWRDSLRFAVDRLGSVLLVTVLSGLGLLAGALCCIVPGVWLYGVWAVAMPALLVEGARGRRALGRSYQLVRGRFWPVLGTVLLGALLGAVVQGIFAAPVTVLTLVDTNAVVVAAGTAVANLVGTALVTPFTAALVMVVYFDLRVRKEGFDLFLLAEHVGVTPPAAGFPDQPGARAIPGWGAGPYPPYPSAPPPGGPPR